MKAKIMFKERRTMKKKLILALSLLLMSGFASKSAALMGVTDVKIRGKKATVVLDGFLKISEIKILKRGNRIKIKPPVYVSKSGRVYPQVKFVNSELEKRVITAIKMGKPLGSKSKRLKYKVSKLSLYRSRKRRSSLRAFAAVTFNNEIEIECKVMSGRRGDWVAWPARPPEGGGKWIQQVSIIKPEIKKRVERSVIKKYKKETSYEAVIVPGGKTLPLKVTSVEVTPVESAGSIKAIASIVLNNAIKISEIKVKKISGRTSLKFPEYVSKRGRVYPQVKVLDPAAEKEIISAVRKEEPSAETSNKISFKVSKFSLFNRSSSKLKAFCSVVFNNKIEIECKVMEGKWGPWISWPARPPDGGGKWIQQVEIKDRNLAKAIEKALVSRYEEETGGSSEDDEEY